MNPAPTTTLVFLDTETTGLDKLRSDVIEAAWAVESGPVHSIEFPHTLVGANPEALKINRYFERLLDNMCTDNMMQSSLPSHRQSTYTKLKEDLTGATIVAENYGFDTAMLLRKLGYEPWHYRPIELSTIAMVAFDLDRPESLHKTAKRLRDEGFEIPMADHSARADVECLRACYTVLRANLHARLARPWALLPPAKS
jgi:DNA polymerase III alpha subunit (gram-positive type)